MAKISIIMPVYNAAKYISECLDSIIGQDFRDWELVAVDDFSTDESRAIISQYAHMDSRINILSNNVKGISPALELGYSHCEGNYITRMDADDIMPVEKLGQLYYSVKEKSKAVAVGKVQYLRSDKPLAAGYERYAAWLNNLIDTNTHFQNIYKECVLPSPCWMMSGQTFEWLGGFQSWAYPEDYDLVFRMYKHNLEVIGIDKVLHIWRDHDSRSSRNDDNYADQNFTHMKVHYFLELDKKNEQELILWGAGRAGKAVAKLLVTNDQVFTWVTDNQNKIGHDIYGNTLQSLDILNEKRNCQIITAIKTPDFPISNETLFSKLRDQGCQFLNFH